jgi:hypothetical protein
MTHAGPQANKTKLELGVVTSSYLIGIQDRLTIVCSARSNRPWHGSEALHLCAGHKT